MADNFDLIDELLRESPPVEATGSVVKTRSRRSTGRPRGRPRGGLSERNAKLARVFEGARLHKNWSYAEALRFAAAVFCVSEASVKKACADWRRVGELTDLGIPPQGIEAVASIDTDLDVPPFSATEIDCLIELIRWPSDVGEGHI